MGGSLTCERERCRSPNPMKTQVKIWSTILLAAMVLFLAYSSYQHYIAFVLGAPEDREGLWMAALKGFEGTPRYVGSLGNYSYFRVGDLICSRYKAPTARLNLPKTFPLGEGTPYKVTFEMVPTYP